jgi:hypothetical protein
MSSSPWHPPDLTLTNTNNGRSFFGTISGVTFGSSKTAWEHSWHESMMHIYAVQKYLSYVAQSIGWTKDCQQPQTLKVWAKNALGIVQACSLDVIALAGV